MSSSLPMTARMARFESSTPHQSAENRTSNDLQSLEAAPLADADWPTLIGLALSRSGLTHKQACAFMGVDQSLWTKQLHGDGHVSLQRLGRLPLKFWLELLSLLGAPLDIVVGHPQLQERVMANVFELMARLGQLAVQHDTMRRAG
jgi:hypothetical protein